MSCVDGSTAAKRTIAGAWYHQSMTAADNTLCTVAAPGVEVVTEPTSTGWRSVIHGGRLDGERFTSAGDPEQQHHKACVLARMSGWGPRRIRVRRARP